METKGLFVLVLRLLLFVLNWTPGGTANGRTDEDSKVNRVVHFMPRDRMNNNQRYPIWMCQLKIKRARHRLNFHWRPSTSNRKVRCRRSLWMIQSASIAHISINTHSINRMLNGKKKSINKPNEAFAVVKWCEVHRSNWKFAAIVWYILLLGGADRTIHVSNSNFTLISTESAYINNLSLSLSLGLCLSQTNVEWKLNCSWKLLRLTYLSLMTSTDGVLYVHIEILQLAITYSFVSFTNRNSSNHCYYYCYYYSRFRWKRNF